MEQTVKVGGQKLSQSIPIVVVFLLRTGPIGIVYSGIVYGGHIVKPAVNPFVLDRHDGHTVFGRRTKVSLLKLLTDLLKLALSQIVPQVVS